MKTLVRRSAVLALIGFVLSPLAVAHALPTPADSVHFCQLIDFEQWQRDHPRPAGKRLALNVGEPRTVRMIYFLPNDRPFRQEVVDEMKAVIRQVQTFYAEQRQAHGYGDRTFRIETDAQGEPLVHRVDGQHPDSNYLGGDVFEEIRQRFDLERNIYLIVLDNSTDLIGNAGGIGGRGGKSSGYALVPSSVHFETVAHELGHAFGLQHDFRDGAYIMSYGPGKDRLSACAAEFLSVHPYFNPEIPTKEGPPPTIELISPRAYPAGSESIPIQLKVSDSKGLHQVILFGGSYNYITVKAYRGLLGKSDAVVEFEYDGDIPSASVSSPVSSLSDLIAHPIHIQVVDSEGDVTWTSFMLLEASPHLIATLEGHTDRVNSVSFSPYGTLIASGSQDGTVILWDVATRDQIATLKGHTDGWYTYGATSVSFSAPDGAFLATGGRDGTVILWDVLTREKIVTFGHTAEVNAVSFSPDGTTLVAGGEDGTISLWNIEQTPHSLTKVSGDGQEGSVGEQLAKPFVVSVLDQDGSAFAGAVVTFSVTAGGGTLSAATVTTDANGRAATRLTLGSDPGTNTVSATVAGLEPVTFTTTAVVQTAHSLTKVSGDNQESPASTQLAAPFVVSVLDQDSSPLAGVDVTFSVAAGGGMLSSTTDASPCTITSSTSSTTVTTDANGQAATKLTLGSGSGTNTVSATVEGLEAETFTATAAEQAMPHSLTKVCGDDQEGTAGALLAEPLVVSVVDEDGAAMAGVVVSFAVTAGGGTLSAATATTDANGRAATRLTLGSDPGTNTVSATVEGLEPRIFTATGQESPFASLFDLFGGGKRVALPDSPQLAQNAPNPFNSQTVLAYFLPAPSSAHLEVFTLTGQRVAVLHQGLQQAGYHRLHWNGRDDAGRPVASGMYLYRLVTVEGVLTRKLILLR